MDKTRVYLTESLSNKEKKGNIENADSSILATIIKILGYLIILASFVAGGYLVFARIGIDFFTIIISLISSLIIGTLLLGLGKVISLLQEINHSLKK